MSEGDPGNGLRLGTHLFSTRSASSQGSRSSAGKFWLAAESSVQSSRKSGSGSQGQNTPSAEEDKESAPEHILEEHRKTGLPISVLRKLDEEGLLSTLARGEKGELMSVGSAEHEAGQCSKCVFFARGCCSKGVYCSFCHFSHAGGKSKTTKPKKSKQASQEGAGGADPVASPP